MPRIVTLGPAGTFSELASQKYILQSEESYDLEFLPTIKEVLHEIGKNCDIGILPIENFSEGFLALVLDELVDLELSIIDEILLPVEFSFVTNCPSVSDVEKLYVQFVAKGQCKTFIQELGLLDIQLTESNSESLQCCIGSPNNVGAIVPSGSRILDSFSSRVDNINDYKDNQTRFLVLTPNKKQTIDVDANQTSVIVVDDNDHPGLLGEVLQSFSSRNINLSSIISRPTRKTFGKYHFYIELEGSATSQDIDSAIKEIAQKNKIKFLGSYKKASIQTT